MSRSSLHITTQKHFIKGLIFLSLIYMSVFASSATFANSIKVQALDTIAGYGTEISVYNAQHDEAYQLILHTPQDTTQTYQKTSQQDGTIEFQIPKKDTYQAGKYEAVVVPQGFEFEDGNIETFEVFADDPSASLSKIKTENISLSTGKTGTITVLVQDQYGNKISGHRIHLVSSRSEDEISGISGNRTDKNGQVTFEISSLKEGNARLSAVDETAGISFSDRKSILFYESGTRGKNKKSRFSASMFAGGDEDISSDVIDSNIPKVTEFKIDFPNTVLVNSDENFLTISAVNTEGEVVKEFDGTVFIRVPGDANAQVPGQDGKYTFQKRDQGKFTFSRSLVFSKTGPQKIEVFLYNLQDEEINVNIFGKKSVLVKAEGEFDSDIITPKIQILSPEHNSKFSSKDVSVHGKSYENSDVKIFVDMTPYKTVSTGDSGEFTVILNDLEDGTHQIYAKKDGSKKRSQTVKFSIDSSAPLLKNFEFSKEKFSPYEKGTLTVETLEEAKKVEMIFNNDTKLMENISGNIWEYEFSAPAKADDYLVKINIIDEYQNSAKIPLQKKLVVKNSEISQDILSGEFSEEKQKILLSWKKPAGVEPILYILHTGDSPQTLKKSKSISGSTLQMEYEKFEIGDTVYIAISPVNTQGEELQISNIVKVETFKKVIPEKTPEFFLTGEDEKIAVKWDAAKNVHHYNVMYGMESGKYLMTNTKNSSENSDTIIDLISGETYVVRLIAKDSMGNTILDYGEKSVKVGKSRFHSAPTQAPQPYPQWITKTGPTLFLFIGAIFFLFGGWVLSRKERR